MRAVIFTGAGDNGVVQVVERRLASPGVGEVAIRPRFCSLNPADIAQREGRYPAPAGAPADIPGLEVAGEVVAIGPGVARWKEGDRVMGLVAGGGFASEVIANESHLVRIPPAIDDRAAAAVPEAFITAHDGLRQGGLKPGETVLVTGANGGVGTAGIQIAKELGGSVVGAVREPDLAARVAGRFGIETVAPQEMIPTCRRRGGASLALELVGGAMINDSLAALRSRGRLVLVGLLGGSRADLELGRLVGRRLSVIGTVLRSRSNEEKAEAVRAFEEEVLPFLASGAATPVVDAVFGFGEVRAAFDHLRRPGRLGKVLLEVDRD
jgi:NADPH:quinone reductase